MGCGIVTDNRQSFRGAGIPHTGGAAGPPGMRTGGRGTHDPRDPRSRTPSTVLLMGRSTISVAKSQNHKNAN